MTQKNQQTHQLNRIKEMELIVRELETEIAQFKEQVERFESKQKKIQKLRAYYGSKEWFQDVDSYEEGSLPEDEQYSVLGEDLAFDLLGDNYRIAIQLLEVATHIIKNH